MFLPYVKVIHEKVERVCYKLGIQAVFKCGSTLRQYLRVRVKSRRPDEKKKGVVYEVPCGDCDGPDTYPGGFQGFDRTTLNCAQFLSL